MYLEAPEPGSCRRFRPRRWSIYGAERTQPTATVREPGRRGIGSNKANPSPVNGKEMTCSETPSAQAWYARDVVSVDGARGGLDGDRSGVGCASKADHLQGARPRYGRAEARSDRAGRAGRRACVAGAVRRL